MTKKEKLDTQLRDTYSKKGWQPMKILLLKNLIQDYADGLYSRGSFLTLIITVVMSDEYDPVEKILRK